MSVFWYTWNQRIYNSVWDVVSTYRNISKDVVFSPKDIVLRRKLLFQVFVSFVSMSYNPDTGIKDPCLSLKF